MLFKVEPYVKIQTLIFAKIYLGQLISGYAFGWSASVISKLKDSSQTPLPETITDHTASLVVAVYFTGGILGPYLTIFLSNVIGRKPCLIFGSSMISLGFVILALANNLALIYTGRFVCGFGLGISCITSLVYIGEIASTHIRGIFLILTQIFTNLGMLLNYSIAPHMSYSTINYLAVAFTLVNIVGLFFIPETPLCLIIKGKEKESKQVLELLRRENDFDSILAFKEQMEPNTKQWLELFSVKSNRKALFITLSLYLLQQFSGNLTILSFVTVIFELANTSISAYVSTIIVSATQIIAGGIAPFFVERSGRKALLLWSTAVCFITMGLLATYFYLDEIKSPIVASIQWLPLLSLITFTMSFALGFGIIPSTFIGEMFTPNSRTFGATVVVTLSWVWALAVTIAFSYLLQLGTQIAFWVLAVGCAVTFFFSLFVVPETKGKSLFEVQEMLSR